MKGVGKQHEDLWVLPASGTKQNIFSTATESSAPWQHDLSWFLFWEAWSVQLGETYWLAHRVVQERLISFKRSKLLYRNKNAIWTRLLKIQNKDVFNLCQRDSEESLHPPPLRSKSLHEWACSVNSEQEQHRTCKNSWQDWAERGQQKSCSKVYSGTEL